LTPAHRGSSPGQASPAIWGRTGPCACRVACRHVTAGLNRRGFLGAGAAAAGAALAGPPGPAVAAETRSFARVVDLTHTISPELPTYFGQPQISFEPLFTYAKQKFNLNVWTLNEHTGTHVDAPFHFSEDGWTVDRIPAENVVCPLCIVDIAARVQDDPDTQVTPDDLEAYEAEHGPIPPGACVAMRSGWDAHVATDKFRNADAEGVLHFPGFHPEAAAMLMDGRQVVGIGVDTLSLDHGRSKDFAVHYAWLPTNRWGIEAMAGLGGLPPSGATLLVGAPKVKGATGGPARLYALV
jgi:kynurenine formamidase